MMHVHDKQFGANIRAARAAKGMGQERLAKKVGVTFQQIQKYEHGVNRVSISRAVMIADALGVPFAALLDGIVDTAPAAMQELASIDREVVTAARLLTKLDRTGQVTVLSVIQALRVTNPAIRVHHRVESVIA